MHLNLYEKQRKSGGHQRNDMWGRYKVLRDTVVNTPDDLDASKRTSCDRKRSSIAGNSRLLLNRKFNKSYLSYHLLIYRTVHLCVCVCIIDKRRKPCFSCKPHRAERFTKFWKNTNTKRSIHPIVYIIYIV